MEVKAADAENDGDSGSGDEGGREEEEEDTQPLSVAQVSFAEVGRQDQRRVCLIPHFHWLTCFNLDPLFDALSLRNSWNSPAGDCGLITAR